MEKPLTEIKSESINSLESAIRKSEKALTQMSQKGANTTLIEKRLSALRVSLKVLNTFWNQTPHSYNQAELSEARIVLVGLLPSIKSAYVKSKAGSPQKTLTERRIKALELAIEAIGQMTNNEGN